MAPVTRSQAQKRKIPQDTSTKDDPNKKARLAPKECPETLKLLKDLGLQPDFLKTKASACALDPKDPAFKNITAYINRSMNGSGWKFSIFKIATNVKGGKVPKEHEAKPKRLRKMLWHGTPAKNVTKILEHGLQLPKWKSDPYFGVGIYFSDRFTYSHDYCNKVYTPPDKTGRWLTYVFLSDVLLGEIYKSYQLIPKAPMVKVRNGEGWKSVKVESIQGCARLTPNPKGDQLIDGCVWPLGEPIIDPLASLNNYSIPSNEYVIYEAKRAIPKYLVKVELELSKRKKAF